MQQKSQIECISLCRNKQVGVGIGCRDVTINERETDATQRQLSGYEKMKGVMVAVMMVVMMVAVVAMGDEATPSAAECKEEKRLAIHACMPVVYWKDPSPACCERIRVTHVNCVCPVVTPKLAALVDVNRAVQVIQSCGRKVPRHYKCGSTSTTFISFPLLLY